MVETFHFAAGHCDFKRGLKKGHTIISLQSATKGDRRSAELLACPSSLQYLPLFHHYSGQLVGMFVLSSLLVPPHGERGASCNWTSCFPRLSVINKHVAMFFYVSENRYNFGLGAESGKVSNELWNVRALGRQQIAAHPATSHLPHSALMLGMTAALCSSSSH